VLRWLSKICPVEVLDVGSGGSSWPHLMANCGFQVTAIDKIKEYWKGGFFNRHYYVINDDITRPKITKQFDLITCISVLEHIPNHKDAVSGMFRLLKPGGHLVLTFPYNERQYIDDIYKLPDAGYGRDYPFICQVLSRSKSMNGSARIQERLLTRNTTKFLAVLFGRLATVFVRLTRSKWNRGAT